ncbi:shikimate kinase [Nocardioides sp. MH1]|uniref:shikimate kinase n=1 Tax=Nocardioides sp. MH1 TaxID=3242490 RepID=UPI00352073D1
MSRPVAVLVGTMGAGKTTAGRLLAEALGVGFLDSDHAVEAHAGKSVQDIFVDDGEAAFRTLEREAVAAALESHDGVLALGGGAVLDASTRALLADQQVVFLRVGLADAVKRVGLGAGRPLLLGNVRSRVKQLLDERTPVYEGLARISVDTDGRTPQDVVAEVVGALGRLDTSSPRGSDYSTSGEEER